MLITDYNTNKIETYNNLTSNSGTGLIEFKNGNKIEFLHNKGIINGEAKLYFTNGDIEIFNYFHGEKIGKAIKL